MDEQWQRFRTRFQIALDATHAEKPEMFKELWSHRADVSILGALGGFERGWSEVGPRLDWASTQVRATGLRLENILTVVGQGMAITADLERMMRVVDGQPVPRTLRCTQVYRIEEGEWKIFHRHADELQPAAR
jgi:hypothetical protein